MRCRGQEAFARVVSAVDFRVRHAAEDGHLIAEFFNGLQVTRGFPSATLPLRHVEGCVESEVIADAHHTARFAVGREARGGRNLRCPKPVW